MNIHEYNFIVLEKKMKKIVFFPENQLLRERFKVTLKQNGKKK